MHKALITGGTSGIGAAFARAFARRRVDLVLVARNTERLEHTAAEITETYGVHVEVITADLVDRRDQQRVAERLESTTDPIDIFVNNAGFSVRAGLLDKDLAPHDLGIEVMIRAALALGGAAGRAMKAQGRGWIINVGSVSGIVTQNNYTAIKAWMNNYSESLGVQLQGTGVSVTCLMPGWVRTEFHSRAGISGSSIPDVLWIDADELVEQCLQDVARGKLVSVPTLRWKIITAALRSTPRAAISALSATLSHRRSKER